MFLNTGTPKKNNFSFEANGKLMALGVPILKHFRVITLKTSTKYNFMPPTQKDTMFSSKLKPINRATMHFEIFLIFFF